MFISSIQNKLVRITLFSHSLSSLSSIRISKLFCGCGHINSRFHQLVSFHQNVLCMFVKCNIKVLAVLSTLTCVLAILHLHTVLHTALSNAAIKLIVLTMYQKTVVLHLYCKVVTIQTEMILHDWAYLLLYWY